MVAKKSNANSCVGAFVGAVDSASSVRGGVEATADEVRFATEYLQSNPSFLELLADKRRIDEIFSAEVIGERRFLLRDVNKVRSALEKNCGEAYTWSESSAVQTFLEKMAREKYLSGASELAAEKLMTMDSERAKEFLMRLVRDNYSVGIEILRGDGT